MPDDYDYEWLRRLLKHPEGWSEADLAGAQSLLENEQRALDESHPQDAHGRRAKQELVDALAAAIEKYDLRR